MRLQEAKIGYPGHEAILNKVDFDVDLETRIALIGPNGAGKSTVVKALLGDLEIFDGTRIFHNRLKVGIFTQHHADSYDLKKRPWTYDWKMAWSQTCLGFQITFRKFRISR